MRQHPSVSQGEAVIGKERKLRSALLCEHGPESSCQTPLLISSWPWGSRGARASPPADQKLHWEEDLPMNVCSPEGKRLLSRVLFRGL